MYLTPSSVSDILIVEAAELPTVRSPLTVTAPVNVPPLVGILVLSATVILAEPLNDTPLMVLAVVSVAALPVVFWFSVATRAAATVPVLMLDPFNAVRDAPEPENVGAAIFSVDVRAVVDKVSLFTPAVVNPIESAAECHIPVFWSDVQVKDGSNAVSASIPWNPPLVVELALNVGLVTVPVNVGDAVGALVLSATVILAEPLNDTPLIVRAVCRTVADPALPVVVAAVVAVVALPDSAAVIVPAEKLPDAFRATIVLTVLRLVALDVTVNVPPSDADDPERPTPDTEPAAT
jgi:hypothetical protein